jgi:alpha-N-arabinofuranosidase
MYKVHQDATLLPTHVESPVYVPAVAMTPNPAQAGIPMSWDATHQLSASASRDAAGKMHLSLCNLHHEEAAEATVELRGAAVSKVTGRILTAPAMNTMNSFDKPETVKPAAFDGAKLGKTGLTVSLPARSVIALELL